MPKIYLEGLYKDFAIDPTFWRAYADWEPQSSVGSPKTVFLTPPSGGGQNPRFGGFGRSATSHNAKVRSLRDLCRVSNAALHVRALASLALDGYASHSHRVLRTRCMRFAHARRSAPQRCRYSRHLATLTRNNVTALALLLIE